MPRVIDAVQTTRVILTLTEAGEGLLEDVDEAYVSRMISAAIWDELVNGNGEGLWMLTFEGGGVEFVGKDDLDAALVPVTQTLVATYYIKDEDDAWEFASDSAT